MKRWLQEFSFKKSYYERPNQNWVCGRACQGQGCLSGPDAKGGCTATTECRPLRKGDRWHCTRPASQGGPCTDGPRPDGTCPCVIPKCTPVRSLRSARSLTVMLVVAVSLAGLFYALSSRQGVKLLSPGQLSFAHASFGSDCSDCHAGVGDRPVTWLTTAQHAASISANSQMCLQCHNVGNFPFQPHSLPAESLARLTTAIQTNATLGGAPAGLKVARFIAGPAHPGATDLACATCHKEHRGTQNDLRKLANAQCQSCHARQFDSLASGHPAFTTYPFDRRSRIIFDHQTHISEHFTDAAYMARAPRTCVDCHQVDLNGNSMGLKPFETICASCHGAQIKGKGAVSTGLAVLSLPDFDHNVMTGRYAIGQWPDETDQTMTPFMRLLLSAEPSVRSALDALAGADLNNLPKNDTNKLAAAQQLAWGIKGLIYDLSRLGQDELSRRLEGALGHPITDHQREGVVAFLNAETLRSTFQSSFPNLATEVQDYRKKQEVAKTKWVSPSPADAPADSAKPADPDKWVANGGWYTTDNSFTLFYRPRGHADRFLSSWMDLTASATQAPAPKLAQAVFTQLAAPKGVGYCAKCHSVDDVPEQQPDRIVNWLGTQPDITIHKFNRFSHSAHLSLIENQGCFTCHPLKTGDAKATYADAFAPGQHDPSKYFSNFQVIDKTTCAQCHRPGRVRDDCLLCHNYHVGAFRAVIPNVKMHNRPPVVQTGLSDLPGTE